MTTSQQAADKNSEAGKGSGADETSERIPNVFSYILTEQGSTLDFIVLLFFSQHTVVEYLLWEKHYALCSKKIPKLK